MWLLPKQLKRTQKSIVHLQTWPNHFPVAIVSRNKNTAIHVPILALTVTFQAITFTCHLSRVVGVHSSDLAPTASLPLSCWQILLKRIRTSTSPCQHKAVAVPWPWWRKRENIRDVITKNTFLPSPTRAPNSEGKQECLGNLVLREFVCT